MTISKDSKKMPVATGRTIGNGGWYFRIANMVL
jgi:hypothetical protein